MLALVTSAAVRKSHTAIIARALGLPAVVAVTGVDELADGTASTWTAPPGPSRWTPGTAQVACGAGLGHDGRRHPGRLRRPWHHWRTGIRVPLLANVGGAADAVKAAAAGAQGVGLLRTEFCFLERETEPSIEEQVVAYRGVFDAFPGRKVVVRTLDAGADKPLPFLTDATEPNPALGVRGYRTDLASPGVLERQLTAIAAAAAGSEAEVWVMAPMISTAAEAGHFAALCATAGLETSGVMVEVPLRRPDRGNHPAPGRLRQPGHQRPHPVRHGGRPPARPAGRAEHPVAARGAAAGQLTVAGALAEGHDKPVGVCGEAAADPALAVVLVGLGVTSLSMTARALAAVGAVLGSVTQAHAQALARLALAAPARRRPGPPYAPNCPYSTSWACNGPCDHSTQEEPCPNAKPRSPAALACTPAPPLCSRRPLAGWASTSPSPGRASPLTTRWMPPASCP